MIIVERIKCGVNKLFRNKLLIVIPIAHCLFSAWMIHMVRNTLYKLKYPFSSSLFVFLFSVFMVELSLIICVLIITLLGRPVESKRIEKGLIDIGFFDRFGKGPILLLRQKCGKGYVLEFYHKNISLEEYEKHREKLEVVLNMKIIEISTNRDMRHVRVKAIALSERQGKSIRWQDDFISNKDFELVLGESFFGNESIDIAITPHILIGGGSGSGKTVLLKLILWECLKKGAEIHLADFKGGVDYSPIWHTKCNIITSLEDFDILLSCALQRMEERRSLFLEVQVPNIGQYNQKNSHKLPRIIIACDEVAEVLDKTGLGKAEKATVESIEGKLNMLARQGRAFGLHIILSTQRPSADLLNGQIKNNIGYRVCGRADKVLSQIVLDNTSAAEMISHDDQGVFITNTGVLFKGFWFDDDQIEETMLKARNNQYE